MTTAGEISGTGRRFYQEPQLNWRDPHDFYVEERWCDDALLEAEQFTGGILDPACGSGNILRSASAHGLDAIGSDLVNRGQHCRLIGNFLDPDCQARLRELCGGEINNIVCNPPYGRGVTAAAFIIEAIKSREGRLRCWCRTSSCSARDATPYSPIRLRRRAGFTFCLNGQACRRVNYSN
jgi:hypothetical protein